MICFILIAPYISWQVFTPSQPWETILSLIWWLKNSWAVFNPVQLWNFCSLSNMMSPPQSIFPFLPDFPLLFLPLLFAFHRIYECRFPHVRREVVTYLICLSWLWLSHRCPRVSEKWSCMQARGRGTENVDVEASYPGDDKI